MVKTLRMSYDGVEVIKKNFYSTQSDFGKNKDTTPESVDGGDSTDYIAESIVKIAKDVGYIALALKLGGDKVAGAIDKIKGVDESVAQIFRDADKKVTSRAIMGISMSRFLEAYHLSTILLTTWKIYAMMQVMEATCLAETQ